MERFCPHHQDTALEKAVLASVEVDYCPVCYGLWFDEEELRWAKDEREDLQWLDVDLWKRTSELRVAPGDKPCPEHRLPLYEVEYGDSGIKVDVCNLSHGIWLDRGEYRAIISYLEEKGQHEVLYNYMDSLLGQTWEVFTGPDMLREEVRDVAVLLKLMQHKFLAKHPHISKLLVEMPK